MSSSCCTDKASPSGLCAATSLPRISSRCPVESRRFLTVRRPKSTRPVQDLRPLIRNGSGINLEIILKEGGRTPRSIARCSRYGRIWACSRRNLNFSHFIYQDYCMLLGKRTIGRFGCHNIRLLDKHKHYVAIMVKVRHLTYLCNHTDRLAECEIRENVEGKVVEPAQYVNHTAGFT